MNAIRRRLGTDDTDSGVAMITVLLVGMLLTAIAVGSISIATNNLKNAGRDRVGAGALGSAEAGLAEAINHMRGASLTCLRVTSSCTKPDSWAAHNGGVEVSLPDGRVATVTITEITPYRPPTSPVGRYRIRSIGSSGEGPGRRTVEQEVTAKPLPFPLSVYANSIASNGTPAVFQQSVLSKNDICGRDKLDFANSTDPAYGIPAAAHSAGVIWEGKCGQKQTNRIHHGSACNTTYPFDQDALGAALPSSSPCKPDQGTSKFTVADFARFGGTDITPLLPLLRSQAIAQGTYFTSVSGWTPPDPVETPHAVLYFQVGKDAELKLQNELDGYDYNCGSPRSVIVVVDNASIGNGGITLNSNADPAGALFLPRGDLKFNGNAVFTGPIFANSISQWLGGAQSQLTECYLDNLPPGLLDIQIESYREVDSIG